MKGNMIVFVTKTTVGLYPSIPASEGTVWGNHIKA